MILPEGRDDGRLLGCPVGDRADMLLMTAITMKQPKNKDSSFNIENNR